MRTRVIGAAVGCMGLAVLLAACDESEQQKTTVQSRTAEVKPKKSADAASLPDSGLSWSTFDDYPYEDIGSGLYVRIYEIGGGEQLRVSGTSMKLNPMGIARIHRDGTETTIKGQEEWERVREQIAMN